MGIKFLGLFQHQLSGHDFLKSIIMKTYVKVTAVFDY